MSKPTAFPLDESKLPFRIPKDQPFRENIAKLGQMITDRIPAKKGTLTQDAPEYWGLASIVTDEMAEVALKMKVRKPMTLPELVKATGKPADELEPLLQQMAVVGLLEYNWENPRREEAVHPADVRARQCGIFQYEQTADRRPPRGHGLLRADDLFAAGTHHRHGAAGRRGYRYARHPGGKGHRDRKPVRRRGAYLPLAEKV